MRHMGAKSNTAAELRNALQPQKHPDVPETMRIHVHAAVSRVAVFYEKMRNAVDYKEEHILRKSATRRILKRQILLEKDAEPMATNVIRELIGARYLPNGILPESVIGTAALIIQKYLSVISCRVLSLKEESWLIGLVSVELEDLLAPHDESKLLVTMLYDRLATRVSVIGSSMGETDIRLQVYIACYRLFLKADDEILSFKLLRAFFPEWMRPNDWISEPTATAERIVQTIATIQDALHHPLSQKFIRVVKPWSVGLIMLRDALKEKPSERESLLEKPEALRTVVARLVERRYREAKRKLRRGAFRATVYLFLTKMLLALLIEVPVEKRFWGSYSDTSLLINILFPPFLMLMISFLISVPGKENTEKIMSNVALFLTGESVPMRDIRIARKRSSSGQFLLNATYAILFCLIFGAIGFSLNVLNFTWISTGIFIFFLCVVSFFAFRLRSNAREFIIVEGHDTIRATLVDFISLPILRVGQWLSMQVSRLNVFLFVFDFIVEAPFKIFLTVMEEWFSFIKEKKEELH